MSRSFGPWAGLVALALLGASLEASAQFVPPVDPMVAGATYDDQDHSGHDHSGEDLVDVNFRDANFSGVDFTGSDLSFSNVDGSLLTGAVLVDTNLYAAWMRDADVTGADLTGANLGYTDFGNTIGLTQAQIRSAGDLIGVRLFFLDLTGWDLSGLDLTSSSFSEATVTGVSFAGSNLTDAFLGFIDLGSTDLSGANLADAILSDSGISAAQLRGATSIQGTALYFLDLSGQDLAGLDFTDAQIVGTNLSGADLSGATLANVDLRDSDMTSANLANALLTNPENTTPDMLASVATLAGATLEGLSFAIADLGTLDLTGASLTDVDLQHTDLADVVGLTSVTFSGICLYDLNTHFPPGFDPIASGLTLAPTAGIYGTQTAIVRSEDLIPGTTETFGDTPLGLGSGGIAMNDAGLVAFNHESRGIFPPYQTVYWTGIYTGDGGPVATVVADGDAAPGTASAFGPSMPFGWGPIGLNAEGDISFGRNFSPGSAGSRSGAFRSAAGVVSPVALAGEAAPVAGGGPFLELSTIAPTTINDSGRTVFFATYTAADGSTGTGVFEDVAGVQAPVFLSGDPAPGTGGGTYLPPQWGAGFDQNDAGEVVAAMPVADGSAPEGIFLHSGGVDSAVAVIGDPAPGTGGGSYSALGSPFVARPRLDESGNVVFQSEVSGGTVSHGIFMASGGIQRLVAGPGSPAPGTGTTFDSVDLPAINAHGTVVFRGTFAGSQEGIFLDVGGLQLPIALTGEPAAGGLGGTYEFFGPPVINGNGDVAFPAVTDFEIFNYYDDGIYRLPEPGFAWMLACGSIMIAAVRLPRNRVGTR